MQPDWERYSCQMALPGFDEKAQQRLQDARILIVGAGGLGCPVAQYLTAAGVGNITIADDDAVSESNLHRQILYTPADIGSLKSVVACERLSLQNPQVKLSAITKRITSGNVSQLVNSNDIIVDCTDNFETRYLLNDAVVIAAKPLVYGAIYQFEGQVAIWNIVNADGSRSANYRDLYPQVDATQIPNCATGGVIPTLAGIIGCMQANEVIKYLTQTRELLAGKVLVFDAQTMQSRIIKLNNNNTVITSIQPTQEVGVIDAEIAKAGIADGSMQLVDIRTDQEHDEFNIGGMHFELDELADNLDTFDPQKSYVFYCSSGKRSAEAVKLMQEKLPQVKVYSLKGGVSTW
ncbi:thiamine biosynthesis protein [Mucilaginibacter conchicola]|uniref:Thiamine biosynthesis protein n=2 Tax=Mucilaginibacter conchicola TaxID=2303333 RepID=A0A372P069_9SPHI|nr:thiamine biosynthesis protein [Mucilaginibacter conchicola]